MSGDPPEERSGVTPLENRAYFSIDEEDGYVRIEQSVGDQTLYTPDQARDLAEEILAAAATAEE